MFDRASGSADQYLSPSGAVLQSTQIPLDYRNIYGWPFANVGAEGPIRIGHRLWLVPHTSLSVTMVPIEGLNLIWMWTGGASVRFALR